MDRSIYDFVYLVWIDSTIKLQRPSILPWTGCIDSRAGVPKRGGIPIANCHTNWLQPVFAENSVTSVKMIYKFSDPDLQPNVLPTCSFFCYECVDRSRTLRLFLVTSLFLHSRRPRSFVITLSIQAQSLTYYQGQNLEP